MSATIKIKVPPARTALKFSSSKDPSDVFDYSMDFKQLLQSDTISTATVTATVVTIDSSSISGNVVTMFVSGGPAGQTGVVTVKIVTTNATPRTFERSFKIKVEEK
jgi:hypothetical protein